MNNSFKLGLTACALFVAASGAASAADIAAGNYSAIGFITSSSCPKIAGSPQQGDPSTATIVYPGAGKAGMELLNPATLSSSKPGTGATQVCIAAGKVPAAGLNGATIQFNCYNDTEAGPAKTVLAVFSAHFKVGASHSTQAATTEVTATLSKPLPCKFTTDATYAHE